MGVGVFIWTWHRKLSWLSRPGCTIAAERCITLGLSTPRTAAQAAFTRKSKGLRCWIWGWMWYQAEHMDAGAGPAQPHATRTSCHGVLVAQSRGREPGGTQNPQKMLCLSSAGHSPRAGPRIQPSGAAPWESFCCRNVAISFLSLILATERVWLLGRFLTRRLGLLKPPGFFFSFS